MRVLFAVALVAVVVACAHATGDFKKYDLAYCLEYATQHNRSSCTACNVATGMWCESEEHYEMCRPHMEEPPISAESKTDDTRRVPCDVCNTTDLYVRNARAAMSIIHHDCKICNVVLEENDILAQRAVAHMNKKVEKSSGEECGELCSLRSCIEASGRVNFNDDTVVFDDALALECRHQILEICMPED